jgi:hypothetical protein
MLIVDLCDKGPIAMLRQPSERRGVQNNLAAAGFSQLTTTFCWCSELKACTYNLYCSPLSGNA